MASAEVPANKKSEKYGLLSKDKAVYLRESKVHVIVQGVIANVESELHYINDQPSQIEACYVFPVDDMSAVYKLEAQINGKHIIAECQERKQAKITYTEAVSTGHTAMILSESKHSGDVFQLKLGNLEPGALAVINIGYVVELLVEPNGVMNFDLPVVLRPRYSPQNLEADISVATCESQQPSKMEFNADVIGHQRIKSISSTIKGFDVNISDDQFSAKINLHGCIPPEKDLRFSIAYNDISKPGAILELGDPLKDGLLKEHMLMIHFLPDLSTKTRNAKREFIFVMDRSGSMHGSRILKSRAALLLFLKSLPVGCLFNIVSFGSNCSCLFPESREYNDKSLHDALDLQKMMEADMGGTEIHGALSDVYSQTCRPGYKRQIFLLTDGQVNNTAEITSLVRQHVKSTRVFTIGVGDGVSTGLVKNVAKAGQGKAIFIKDDENMKVKIISALELSMEDCLTDIELEWNLPRGFSTTYIPAQLLSVFPGEMVLLFAILHSRGKMESFRGSFILKGRINDKSVSNEVEFKVPTYSYQNQSIHRVAAKHQIKELEIEESTSKENQFQKYEEIKKHMEKIKQQIIVVSKSANIISKYTSFVGVDKDTHDPVFDEKQNGKLLTLHIKTLFGTTITIERNSESTVISLMEALCDFEGIPVDQQRIIYAGRQLDHKLTLESYGIEDGSVLHLVLRLRGGGEGPEPKEKILPPDVTDNDLMLKLVDLQSFDGSWTFSTDLANTLSVDKQFLQKNKIGYKLSVWCTAVVLVFLQETFTNQKDEWKLIEAKALSWLKSQDLSSKSMEQLFDDVKKENLFFEERKTKKAL